MRPSVPLSALSLLAVVALSGCGSGSDGGSDSGSGANDTTLLSKAELTSSLIALEDLGPGFKAEPDDDGDGDSENLGCLDGLDKLDKAGNKPTRDDEATYVADSELALPSVYSTVGTFESETKAGEVLAELRKAVADCKVVDVTDEDGFRLQLAVSTDDDKTDADATGQVNLEAIGTGSTEGIEFPFSLRFSAVQLDNQVTVVGYVNAVKALGAEADALVQRAIDRLAPVAAGRDVPDLDPLNLEVVDPREVLGGGAA